MRTKHSKLLEWLKNASDTAIDSTGTTRGYLKQIAYGHKPVSAFVAAVLERETGGLVTRKELFPSDWKVIWPELDVAA